MSTFHYLGTKIQDAEFESHPFRHLHIEDFLSKEHLDLILGDNQIHFEEKNNSREVIDTILKNGYKVQKFPGCSSSPEEYLRAFEKNEWPTERGGTPIESFGITFRIDSYRSNFIKELISYLNSGEFKKILEDKFGIKEETNIITAVQKNLSKYEISPHPDVREKALTYLLNINKNSDIDQEQVHTHLLKFKKQWEFIYDYWKTYLQENRCWVPWDWCTTEKVINKNNSIVLFAPNVDTLHGIKLDYDHTKFQRTQIYGNLMYNKKVIPQMSWKKLEKLSKK